MIFLPHVRHKSFYVFGLGKSGLSAAQALLRSGAIVHAWDDETESLDAAKALHIPVLPFDQIDWTQQTALILSPGIPHTFPAPHPVAEKAKAQHVPIWCDVELLLQSQSESIFIGITGSNGKSTTTTLVAHILRNAGYQVQEGGNLGIPALDLQPLGKDGIYVLELSSFQLDLCHTPSLDGAIFLNITKNHLERHGGTLEGYLAAKKQIFKLLKTKGQKVIGVDSPRMEKVCADEKGIPISATHSLPKGVFADQGELIDATCTPAVKVMSLDSLDSLRGTHNFQNIAAAYAMIFALKLAEPSQIAAAIRTFKGLPHRQEIVADFKNTVCVNDSKATTLEAAVQSIQQFDSIYWIMGGVAKEGFEDISALLPYVPKIKKAFLIGKSAPDYAKLFHPHFECIQAETMEKAVELAMTQALKCDPTPITVLLAPACASYDQFKNFEHRGDVFRDLVKNFLKNYS